MIDSYSSSNPVSHSHSNLEFRAFAKNVLASGRVYCTDKTKRRTRLDGVEGTASSTTPADISYLNHMTSSSPVLGSLECRRSFIHAPFDAPTRAHFSVHGVGGVVRHVRLRGPLKLVSSIAEVARVSPRLLIG